MKGTKNKIITLSILLWESNIFIYNFFYPFKFIIWLLSNITNWGR